jgi:hypothetical protein
MHIPCLRQGMRRDHTSKQGQRRYAVPAKHGRCHETRCAHAAQPMPAGRAVPAGVGARRLAHQAPQGRGVLVADLFGHPLYAHAARFDQHAGAMQPHALHQRQRALARGLTHAARQRSLRHGELAGQRLHAGRVRQGRFDARHQPGDQFVAVGQHGRHHKRRLRLPPVDQQDAPHRIGQPHAKLRAQQVKHQIGLREGGARRAHRAVGADHAVGVDGAARAPAGATPPPSTRRWWPAAPPASRPLAAETPRSRTPRHGRPGLHARQRPGSPAAHPRPPALSQPLPALSRPSPGMIQVAASARCRWARRLVSMHMPLLSGTEPPDGDTTRQLGRASFMRGASEDAACSTSSVAATLVAKAPGSTRM